jgi:hypothetical protein
VSTAKSAGFKGECHVDRLVQPEDGTSAARVTGRIEKRSHTIPKTLVIVDPAGVIQGVARSWGTNEFISRIFYQGQFSGSGFLGYIRNYDVHRSYAVRCADDGTLSDEKIVVDTPANDLSTP